MERHEHAPAQRLVRRRRALEKAEYPAPGYRAKRQLQAARPVDSELGRVALDPVVQQRRRTSGVVLVTREAPCLGEREHPLVPVELPGDLVVADGLDVQVWN